MPKEKKKGRPKGDEIKAIVFKIKLYDKFKELRVSRGWTREKTLKYLSEKSKSLGNSIGEKRVEQIVDDLAGNYNGYKSRLMELCWEHAAKIDDRYFQIINKVDIEDERSRLRSWKGTYLKLEEGLANQVISKELHNEAIGKLAIELNMSEKEVQQRLDWFDTVRYIYDPDD